MTALRTQFLPHQATTVERVEEKAEKRTEERAGEKAEERTEERAREKADGEATGSFSRVEKVE